MTLDRLIRPPRATYRRVIIEHIIRSSVHLKRLIRAVALYKQPSCQVSAILHGMQT